MAESTAAPSPAATASPASTPGGGGAGGATPAQADNFRKVSLGTYAEPWAAAFAPGTDTLFITEKAGTMQFIDVGSGAKGTVTGLPQVDYGGQGGLGDVAFLPSERSATVGRRTIYLSWVEAGQGDVRGAVVGRGSLICGAADTCAIQNLKVVWRQQPKVTGRGHFSHRIAFSPDERHMFVASGERQKGAPAQDLSNTLGTIVRLNLDGSAAAGNPFAGRGSPSDQIWSYGHRNMLGLHFDPQGRLWDLEHGPKGGDELNLVREGANYGWPIVSDGVDYDGSPIPDHATRPEFATPAISWDPVIAPGDYLFYTGAMFTPWRGQAIITGLKTEALIRVAIDSTNAREVRRYPMERRMREIEQGPDGALYALEDGDGARLFRLTPGA